MRGLVAAATLTLLAGALAGCIGGGAESGDGASGSVPTAKGGAALVLPVDAPAAHATFGSVDLVRVTQWFNGSYEAQHAYEPVDGVRPWEPLGPSDGTIHSYDVTEFVPMGIPVWVTAEIDVPMQHGDVDLWIQAPENSVWRAYHDAPYGGFTSVTYLMLHTTTDPVVVHLFYDVVEPGQRLDYAIRFTVFADPGRAEASIPFALELPPGALVRFEPVAEPVGRGSDPSLLVWNPRDEPIVRSGSASGAEFVVPSGVPGGEYVFLLSEGSPPMNVTVSNVTLDAPPRLRALDQEIVPGPPVTASNPGQFSWTFDVERAPLQVAIMWASPEVAGGASWSLTSPAGSLFSGEDSGGPWFMSGHWFAITGIGEPNLVAGTYEAEATFSQAAGVEPTTASHFVVFYVR